MGFTKFTIIFILAIVITLGLVAYREWKVSNLEKVYNYNLKDLNFWKAIFIMEHSAGQVYMWRNHPAIVNGFTFFWLFIVLYFITWKINED